MNAHSFGFAFGCLLASSKYTIYCTCMMTIAWNGVHTKQLYAMMSDVRMANGYTIFVFCVCVCVCAKNHCENVCISAYVCSPIFSFST